ncbi:Urb2/Npa2 family-domain-containing protein [Aspergillus sergii]|uniref:Urb2/Npa2 family-domain-containing protein n=1 Tax=Aspergillus sergii TaxID=1034303 RepID=A0A5N6XJW5_9EURO|nr:Urb2/Npa2 family-domain-containing protein [Aspergillus sergii]
MPSFAERPRSSQEALLRLEKGSGSPISQLNEAAQIIGLDLALCASHPEINKTTYVQARAAPKEEWVLRWLLKKLRAGKNYRVEPASFLLLRQLIDLIQPKTLATTLKDQKFLAILDHAITDLEDDVFAGLENGMTELGHSDSESSKTLSDSSPQSDKKGTKRKRTGDSEQDGMDIDEQPQTPTSCFLSFIRALDCLYSLVMLASRTLEIDEVASSHLKHALKGEPEMVAVTLGRSFRLAAVASTQFSNARKTTDLQHLLYVFPAILDLWDLRSNRRVDTDSGSSNESFAKYCFQSALRLQHSVRSIQLDTDERAQVLHGVERLIALHVVLPARAAFFDRGGSGIDYSASEPDWSAVKPVSDTFRPILCELELPSQNTSGDIVKKKTLWKTAELLPEFFDIACRSVPRDTFRRQTHDAPWLETLFVAIAELAFSIVKAENTTTYLPEFVGVLERLFRIALDRNVQLSLHTLLTHASYTGLHRDGLSQVEWSLTALLIELGADIFLPNSGLSNSTQLLDALLKKINLHWRSGASQTGGSHETIKNGVLIPLMRAFMSARDLATFMQLWYEQLIEVEEARSQDSSLGLFTVWEDDDVCNVYGDLMRSPLTHTNASAQMHAAATEIRAEDGKVSKSAGAYAQFVILEAGLRNRDLYATDSYDDLVSIIETLKSTLSSKQHLHWRWRLWRLARSLLENNVHYTDSTLAATIMGLVEAAAKSIKRHQKDRMQKLCAPLECFEAYRFTVTAISVSAKSSYTDEFNTLTKDIAEFIESSSGKSTPQPNNSPWNGRVDTLDSMYLVLAYFLTLVRCPDVWHQVNVESRRSLFQNMLSLATSQYHPSSTLETPPSEARFLQAWASVVCHEYLLNAPAIAIDLITVLSERVKEDASNRRLYVESLQRIPTALITRRQRGLLLDLLQDVVVQEDSTAEITVGLLSLMAKLADMPKSTAALTSDWEPIWTVAKAVTLQGTEVDLQIMKAFRNLHRAVISKLLVLSEEDCRRLFKKMYRKVSSKASKLRFIDRDSMDCFFLRISLSQLWLHRKRLSGVDETELAACRQKVFDLVVVEVKSVKDQCKKQKLEETITLIKVLDALEDFEDLATDHAEVEKFLTKIENYVEKSVDSGSSLRRLIRRRVLAGKGTEKSITLPVISCVETLPLQHMYGEEQQLFIRSTTARFQSMTVDQLTQVIQDIRELGFDGENAAYHLLVSGLAVASLTPVEDKESSTAKELSLLCTAVTDSVRRSRSIEHFTLATECLDILLRNQTRCITQWNIDSLLACVAVCASKAGPLISPEYSASIYIRLCRLMGVLFGIHRQKLGGRFHLILPAMQRLLNCLFARSKKRTRSMLAEKRSAQQPFWLAPLQAAHAVHFTRLLTSLCDPTVSAVSRPTQTGLSHEGLTDQTKKAKRIAGQYLQYLIMEYAESSLRGSLAPEVKAAILPGLYSVLDVMSRDTMRALNAGLDVSGRAIFKGLYDDYVKFGKWNKG